MKLLLSFLLLTPLLLRAQVKVAVFAPVYLDSVFEEDVYKAGKGNIPRYVIAGLDFYNGVMLAADSLGKERAPVQVLFYDSKSATGIEQQLQDTALQDVSLVIASFNNREEMKPLADFALSKKILLLSATFPNDGGIHENPSFVMLNPTLGAHLDALFRYIRRQYPTQTITLFRKKGETEDMIEQAFRDLNTKTGGSPLRLKPVTLSDSFSTAEVLSYLDSNRQNVVVGGSLNEAFGVTLVRALGSQKSYRSVVIGMPTWDGVREIGRDVEVVYTTPYNFSRTDKQGLLLTEKYRNRYGGRATDMVFKGFESMYHFTKLLLKYGQAFPAHLSDREFRLFNDFEIRPTRDYLENRKLYFVKKKDGMARLVN